MSSENKPTAEMGESPAPLRKRGRPKGWRKPKPTEPTEAVEAVEPEAPVKSTESPKLADFIVGNKRAELMKERKKTREEREASKRKHEAARAKTITSTFQTLPADERRKYSELVQLVPNGFGYTCYQRIDALFAYFVEGTIRGAARLIGMSEGTILSWAQSSWWKQAIDKIRELKQDELDTQYTKIIDKTIVEIADRLDLGEEKMTRNGDKVRIGVGAKDLMLINAMAYDKRALVRGKPTSITQKTITADDRNKILVAQYKKIAHGESIIDVEDAPVTHDDSETE